MPDPHPAVAAVRHAVRATLHGLPEGVVHAAVSGGADSLGLLAALAFEAPRQGRAAAVVHVDHALQPGSAEQAERVVAQSRALGVPDVRVLTVDVSQHASAGPEGAARAARYAALDTVAERDDTAAVLLAHTRDDQAEQVLLGLARGSGARSLAGMRPARGRYRRPLLQLSRATLVEACRRQDLHPWEDPANADLALTRSRVRHRVLPLLEAELGPGVAAALARSADLLRDDADLLDDLAAEALTACRTPAPGGPDGPDGPDGLDVAALAGLPAAVRTRVLRRACLDAGSPGSDLAAGHVRSVDALVTRWRGQGPVSLPGGLVAVRRYDRLVVEGP